MGSKNDLGLQILGRSGTIAQVPLVFGLGNFVAMCGFTV